MDPAFSRDLNLLVGDDDAAQRQCVVESVLPRGFLRVYTAGSGREALEILKTAPIDAMILDIHMPGFTGIEVIEQCRRAVWHDGRRFIGPGRVPAIFLSGDITPELERRCGATGSPLLPKPIDLTSLRRALDRVLQDIQN